MKLKDVMIESGGIAYVIGKGSSNKRVTNQVIKEYANSEIKNIILSGNVLYLELKEFIKNEKPM